MDIVNNVIQNLQTQSMNILNAFNQLRGNPSIQILLNPIDRRGVDIVYNILHSPQFQENRKKFRNPNNVDVIVESGGGDADAAYHIAKLINSSFSGKITYIIPRAAKSAATLMVCGGDNIVMGDTSELGPLDPQLRQEDGNYISAKAVQATLDLIKNQIDKNDKAGLQIASVLASRINPLILGQYESTLEIATKYQKELLELRMFSEGKDKDKKINEIVSKFAVGYSHHSRVIDSVEAKNIFGDNVEIWGSDDEKWKLVWNFYQINKNIGDLISIMKNAEKNV